MGLSSPIEGIMMIGITLMVLTSFVTHPSRSGMVFTQYQSSDAVHGTRAHATAWVSAAPDGINAQLVINNLVPHDLMPEVVVTFRKAPAAHEVIAGAARLAGKPRILTVEWQNGFLQIGRVHMYGVPNDAAESIVYMGLHY